MAKKNKAFSSKAKTKIKYKTREIIKKVKGAAKNSGLSGKDGLVLTCSAIGGGLGGQLILSKIPVKNANLKQGLGLATFTALAFYGLKKKNKILISAGIGGATTCGVKLLSNKIPFLNGDDELTLDEQEEICAAMLGDDLDTIEILDGEEEYFEALEAPLEGDYFGAPLEGDYFGAPLNGAQL